MDVSERGNTVQETMKLIMDFMKTHQYDTDAFRDDLNTTSNRQSNLFIVCDENMEFISILNRFITNIDCMFYVVL